MIEDKKVFIKPRNATSRALDFVITGAITAVFFLCPLFFTTQVAQNLGFEKMMLFYFLTLLGLVAWVTKAVILGELTVKRTPLDWPIAALLAVFAVSTVLSISPKDSLVGPYGDLSGSLFSTVLFILFYYLVINNASREKIKLFFWSLNASAALIAVYSLLQLFGVFILPLPLTRTIGFNPLGSLSALTMFLIIILPLLVVGLSLLKEIHPGLKNIFARTAVKSVLSLVILASLLVLTLLNGFTFWPAAIVALVVILMFLLSKIVKISSGNLVAPIAVFLLLIILLVLGNFNLVNLNLPVEVSLSRGASYDIAKTALKTNPFFGSGPATFAYDFSKYKGADFNASPLWNSRFTSASGYLFEAAATLGSLGALALVVILLIALSISFISLIKAEDNEARSLILGLFAAFVTSLIFALLFALASSLLLISVLVAVLLLAASVLNYPEKFKNFTLSFRASPKYALALAAIFLSLSAGVVIIFTLGVKIYLADFYAQRSVTATDIGKKIGLIGQATLLAPYQDIYYLSLANSYMSQANQEAAGAKNQSLIENSLAAAIDSGKRGLAIAPNNVANVEAMALIYENASFYVRGALEWAESLYNQAADLDPFSPMPYVRLALINMARANAEKDQTQKQAYIDEALKQYDAALAKKNDLGAAYYGKAVAYETLARTDDAIDQLKKAVISTRDNADYQFELGRLYFNRGIGGTNLSQSGTAEIATGEAGEDLSVRAGDAGGAGARSEDINAAEQLFLNILQSNPGHANALYSLALLYQKTGQRDNAGVAVKRLLELLTDQASIDAVKTQFSGLY